MVLIEFSSKNCVVYKKPVAGRMDRRGGEPTEFVVSCTPNGKAGAFEGNLVINLPEDNSKICYKITANSF